MKRAGSKCYPGVGEVGGVKSDRGNGSHTVPHSPPSIRSAARVPYSHKYLLSLNHQYTHSLSGQILARRKSESHTGSEDSDLAGMEKTLPSPTLSLSCGLWNCTPNMLSLFYLEQHFSCNSHLSLSWGLSNVQETLSTEYWESHLSDLKRQGIYVCYEVGWPKFFGHMTSIMYKKTSKTEELPVRVCFRATLTFTKIFLVDLLLCDHFKGSCHHNQGLLTLGEQIKTFSFCNKSTIPSV